MLTGREFIEAQDAKIKAAHTQWLEAADVFDKAEKASVSAEEQIRRLDKWQRSAREFFRIVNDDVVDSDGLDGQLFQSWKQDRIASAINVLSGIPKHQTNVRNHRSRLGQPDTKYEFDPAVFENMQAVVAWERPEEAKRLRDIFTQASLPIGGFDLPRELKPIPQPSSKAAPPVQRAEANGKRGLWDIVYLSLIIFGILAALCVVAGLFFKAGALALFFFIILLTTGVSIGCLVGGGFAVYRGLTGDTKFKMFGVELSSQSVGVAFMGIGLVIGFFTFREVLGKVENIPAASSPSSPVEKK